MNIAPKENYIKTFSIFFLAMGIGTLIIVYAGFIWWQGLIASLGLWILAGTIGDTLKRINKNIPEEKKRRRPSYCYCNIFYSYTNNIFNKIIFSIYVIYGKYFLLY